jgi:hypothetical protein
VLLLNSEKSLPSRKDIHHHVRHTRYLTSNFEITQHEGELSGRHAVQLHKTGNVSINVTVSCVRVTTVAIEKQ